MPMNLYTKTELEQNKGGEFFKLQKILNAFPMQYRKFPMSFFSAAAVAAWASSSIEYVNSSLFCCCCCSLLCFCILWLIKNGSNIISLLLILVCLLVLLLLFELWIEQLMWKILFFLRECSFPVHLWKHRFVWFVAAGDGRKWNNNKSLNRSYLRCIIGLGIFHFTKEEIWERVVLWEQIWVNLNCWPANSLNQLITDNF